MSCQPTHLSQCVANIIVATTNRTRVTILPHPDSARQCSSDAERTTLSNFQIATDHCLHAAILINCLISLLISN